MAGTTSLGSISSALQTDINNAPSGVVADIIAVAKNTAIAKGFNASQTTQLERISVATAAVETGGTFNPQSVGDKGTSFGEFQLHQGGELGSLSPQAAFDPTVNASVAVPTIADSLVQHSAQTPGAIAALAQRPADQASYAVDVDNLLNFNGGSNAAGFVVNAAPGAADANSPLTKGSTADNSTSTPTTGISTLQKIGGFLLGALLIGIGVMVLFHNDAPPATKDVVKAGATAAAA